MERKKDCPQCRQKCTNRSIFRIYFNNIDAVENPENLIENLDNLTLQLLEKKNLIKNINAKYDKLKTEFNEKK
jgi:TRAF-interacting protein